ncbi:MAG: nitrogen fixation negative regulator NifL [Azoarcus sp.]|nr:nitrogen fixation negative regulator NifL [Azoarcus sp.]
MTASASSFSGLPPDHGVSLPAGVFRDVVEQSAIAISLTDADANILYVNPAFCRITGYGPDEVIWQSHSILSYKSTPKAVYQEMWQALEHGQVWSGRLLNRRRDGSPYVAELTVTPLHPGASGDGRGAGGVRYLGMHRDVTGEHRLSQQLDNHQQLIESVISVAPVAVALLDASGKVVLDNPAYRAFAAEIQGGEFAEMVLAMLREGLGEIFRQAFVRRHSLINQELRFETRGGDVRWYSCSVSWFEERRTSPDAFYSECCSDYILLVMHDISAARRQQEALRLAAMRVMLSEGELDQSLREALAGAAFQLQGPVNLIAAAASLQRRRTKGAEGDALTVALAEALRAGEQAIATLQAAMPPEPEEPSGRVNLNEVLHDVLMLETSAFLAAGIVVDWKPAMVLPPVQGNPIALRTLFRQLVTNAVEAMNGRGRVERNLMLTTGCHGDHVYVSVADSGPGVPEELRLKVFEPFFSTKHTRAAGRGVGLSLAQEIVSRHRGMLEIDPGYTNGCRMVASFPASSLSESPEGGEA